MNNTPRTDAAAKRDAGSFRQPKWKNLLNESRELERENADKDKEIKKLWGLLDEQAGAVENGKKEVTELRESNEEMLNALKLVRSIIIEGAKTGMNCHSGDWSQRLFHSQWITYLAVKKAGGMPPPEPKEES